MKIYPAEIEAGLSEKIEASSVLAYCIPIETDKIASRLSNKKIPVLASVNNPHLHELVTLLVSTGKNKNDDIFLPSEVWAARKTPTDTPFNFRHDEKNVIGHITQSVAVNDAFEVIAEDTPFEELPDKLHILTTAVLYTYWRDPERQKEINSVVSDISENKYYVSMEAAIQGFDFMLTDELGKQYLVERNNDSCFLTKTLRAFGGTSVYKNYTVGRVLRDFSFIGKGLVEKPANPESVIFNDVTAFNGIFSSASTLDENIVTETEMANENTDKLSEVSGLLALAQADVATKAGELANLVKSKDALVAEKSTLEATVAELTQEKSELSKKVAELNEAVAATAASEKAAKDELAKVKAEQLKTSRLSLLAEVGKTKEESEGLVAQFEALSDIQFGEIVKLAKASVKPEVKTEVTAEEVGKEVLESATENKEAALASETSKDEVVLAEKAEIAEFINKNRKAKTK